MKATKDRKKLLLFCSRDIWCPCNNWQYSKSQYNKLDTLSASITVQIGCLGRFFEKLGSTLPEKRIAQTLYPNFVLNATKRSCEVGIDIQITRFVRVFRNLPERGTKLGASLKEVPLMSLGRECLVSALALLFHVEATHLKPQVSKQRPVGQRKKKLALTCV